jgi:hypothetical protein
VTEILVFPSWRDNDVYWIEEEVIADCKPEYYLDKPSEAFDLLFPNGKKPVGISSERWNKHLFCTRSITFELCVLANPDKYTLLQLLLDIYEKDVMLDDILATSIQNLKLKGPNVVLVYKFKCFICGEAGGLTQRDLDFYMGKGYCMPKKCKSCKVARKYK